MISPNNNNSPENPNPSNIVKISEIIRHCDDHGTPQILFYDRGLGTLPGLDPLLGGAFGRGIDENIQQLYTFLSHNYNDGDEIYMFGFSRGAYTVRSLAGFIDKVGLCRRRSFAKIPEAYELYREKLNKDSVKVRDFMREHSRRVKIKLMVCYDTVASLGIPDSIGRFVPFSNGLNRQRYGFHNTTLGDHIENAIHLLSIDENRGGTL